MSEPLVRLSDVADAIVDGFVFRVVTYMHERRMAPPVAAYFRIAPARADFNLGEDEESFVFEPAFRMLFTLSQPEPGIGELLTQEAASTSGNVLIMPTAELSDHASEQSLIDRGWSKVRLPSFMPATDGELTPA